jgi:hypothetical protein
MRNLRLLLLAAIVASALATVACEGTMYVGVGVAGPWGYGPYPYGGGVVVGYPY